MDIACLQVAKARGEGGEGERQVWEQRLCRGEIGEEGRVQRLQGQAAAIAMAPTPGRG